MNTIRYPTEHRQRAQARDDTLRSIRQGEDCAAIWERAD